MTSMSDLARWLHRNVTAIAADEGFNLCFTELAEIRRDIEHVIDTPKPPHHFGPCPEMVEAGHDETCKEPKHPHPCDRELRGNARATEVKCEACGATVAIEGLFERQAEHVGGYSYTLKQLSGTILPALREYVPLRTMQHWAATGKLNPTGYIDDEPKYLLDDVRELWAQAMDETGAKAANGKARK